MRGFDPASDRSDADLLAAYDAQLRDVAEVPGADSWVRIGPVIAARSGSGRGFVTYAALVADDGTPLPAGAIADLVRQVMHHFAEQHDVTFVEWKTRGHDHAPGLVEALAEAGFVPGETESIMIGEAAALAIDVPVPSGVAVRRISAEHDVRAMVAMQDEVFGRPLPGLAEDLLRRLANGRDDLELWIAETQGDSSGPGPDRGAEIVCAGRLEPVPGTEFAGLWGGCTRASWRHRGGYRALTAQRARSAVSRGLRYLHSDSTEYSRPILERSGFRRAGTTTPYEWSRASGA